MMATVIISSINVKPHVDAVECFVCKSCDVHGL